MSALFSRSMCVFALLLAAFAQQQAPLTSPTRPRFSISGTVVNALTGQVLPQTQVMIAADTQNAVAQTMITGGDGRFEFHGLAPAKYALLAQRAGFFRQAYEGHGGYSTAIAVGPNLDSESLVFRLRPEAQISGAVVDEAGEAVPDAQVILFHSGVDSGIQETTQMQQNMADDEGHYRFSHLPPGRYFVVVTARPWYAQAPINRKVMVHFSNGQGSDATVGQETGADSQTGHSPLEVAYPITYYAAATDSSQATPITLNPGDRASADVTLTPVPAPHVRIKMPNSQAGIGVQVFQRVFGQQMSLPAQSQTTNGYTEISGLASGQVVLDVEQFGKVPSEKAISRVMAVDLANDVELDASQASPSTTISGHVALVGATALPSRTFIHLRNLASGEELSSVVTPDGDFQVQAPYIQPGRYVVSVFDNGEAVVSSVAATGAQVSGRIVELAGSGPVQLKILLSPGVGQVKGTAMRGARPQAGVMVVLVPNKFEENPTLFRRDQSDSDGTFTLGTVVPGSYTLVAIENGWNLEWRNPAVLNPYLKNGQVVEVRPGAKYEVKIAVQ